MNLAKCALRVGVVLSKAAPSWVKLNARLRYGACGDATGNYFMIGATDER